MLTNLETYFTYLIKNNNNSHIIGFHSCASLILSLSPCLDKQLNLQLILLSYTRAYYVTKDKIKSISYKLFS